MKLACLELEMKERTLEGFGERLAEFRERRGMTQAELAKQVGVSRRVIAYYEHADAQPRRCFDDVADRIDAGAMAFHAGKVALSRPSPVPVHDDRDVRRQLLEIDLARQLLVRRSGRNPRQQLLKRHAECPWP